MIALLIYIAALLTFMAIFMCTFNVYMALGGVIIFALILWIVGLKDFFDYLSL